MQFKTKDGWVILCISPRSESALPGTERERGKKKAIYCGQNMGTLIDFLWKQTLKDDFTFTYDVFRDTLQ